MRLLLLEAIVLILLQPEGIYRIFIALYNGGRTVRRVRPKCLATISKKHSKEGPHSKHYNGPPLKSQAVPQQKGLVFACPLHSLSITL